MLSERNGVPDSSSRKAARSNACDGALAPGGQLAHVVRLVGDHQRPPPGRRGGVHLRAGGHGGVRDRHAVAVGRLGAVGVGPARVQVQAVAGGVGRPLAADVGGGRDHAHAAHDAAPQQLVRHPQAERGLARRRAWPRPGSRPTGAPAAWPARPPATPAAGAARARAGASVLGWRGCWRPPCEAGTLEGRAARPQPVWGDPTSSERGPSTPPGGSSPPRRLTRRQPRSRSPA